MDTKTYKRIISEGNVLDFKTLKVTKEHLEKTGPEHISAEIERIINENRIEKPANHNALDNQDTDYYKIDLDSEDIKTIINMFYDLEVSSLGIGYETTREASFYASVLDKWNGLKDYNSL